jgi:hypothetical protein
MARRPQTEPPDIAAWRGPVRVQGAVRRELGRALERAEGLSLWDYTVLRTLAVAPERRMGPGRRGDRMPSRSSRSATRSSR